MNTDCSALNETSVWPVQGSEVEGTRFGEHFTIGGIKTIIVEGRGRVV